MGGNVIIHGIAAEPLDLNLRGTRRSILRIGELLTEIGCEYDRKMCSPLWAGNHWTEYLSGSTRHLFDVQIPTEQILLFKPVFGDIDVQIDKNKVENLEKVLEEIDFLDMTYIGKKRSGNTLVTLWNMHNLEGLKLQVDFELVDVDEKTGYATLWSQMMYNSAWEDVKMGFKGVAHKFLMRALNAIDLEERQIISGGKRPTIKAKMSSMYALSSRGLREKLVLVPGNVGEPPLYKEIPSKNAEYVTDQSIIFKHYFGRSPETHEFFKMWSFLGLLSMIEDHFSPEQKKKILDGFKYSLTHDGAQEFSRDPDESLRMKYAMISEVARALG